MNSDNKKIVADLLCMWTTERVKDEEDFKKFNSHKLAAKLESDCLYYWILSCLLKKMYACSKKQMTATVKVTGGYVTGWGVLRTANFEEYTTHYIGGEEFFKVIEETLHIFDNIENYSYSYHSDGNSCEFMVTMVLKSKR